MIEGFGLRTVEILQVKNQATQHFGDKFAFRKAIAVEVSEHPYRLAHDHERILIGYVSVLPIESVFIGAVSRHAIGAPETERIEHILGGHREFLADDLILGPSQKFEIYYNLHIGCRHS